MILTVTPNPALDKFYGLERWPENLAPREEGVTVRAPKSLTSAGGKGVNVSVFLAAHGIETVAMGFLGGHTGQIILRDLLQRGVSANFVWIEEESRTNVALIVRGYEYHPIHIHEEGPTIPPEALAIFLRKYERMLLRATHVVLAGALPPGVPVDFYGELARRAWAKNVSVVIHAGGKAMLRALSERPLLVKPDVREALRFGDLPVRTEEEVIAAGRLAIAQGAEFCLISHRLTGDILVSADGIWTFEAKAPLSSFRNLVGADDALVGGILVGLSQGKDLIESVRYGMAAAVTSAEAEEKLGLDPARIQSELGRVEARRKGYLDMLRSTAFIPSLDQLTRKLREIEDHPVERYMQKEVVVARLWDSDLHTADLMLRRGLKHLPVVDEKGRLVGVVRRIDLLSRL